MDTFETKWIRSALSEYEGALIRYAVHITRDIEQAREVVQDTFLRLCSQKPSRLHDHLAQWLFTVCRNRALDVRRKERRMTALGDLEVGTDADDAPEPSLLVQRQEQLGRVLEIMRTLSPNQQEVLRLKFQNDLSYKQISRITKLSVTNVGFLIHTGLKTIRERIETQTSERVMRRVK